MRLLSASRHELTFAAIRWCTASVLWATLVGVAAIVAGVSTSSNALFGLGANSVLDGSASAVLVWRFRHERAGAHAEAVERKAAFAVGCVMLVIAAYLAVRSVSAIADEASPESSALGLVLAAGSTLVLPVLAWVKLRLARALDSQGLRGDGVLSLAGSVLAGATLLSLVLDDLLDWWWTDAAAALLIAAALVVEGVRTVRSARV